MKAFNIFTYILSAILLIFGIITFLKPSIWTDDMIKSWTSVMIIFMSSYMLDSIAVKKLMKKEQEKENTHEKR